MDLELCHAIDGSHAIVDFLLAQGAVHGFVISAAATLFIVQVRVVQLLIQNASKRHTRVEFDPGRRKHEVDVPSYFIAPEFDHSSQIELADDLVRFNQGVHVCLQSVLRVDRLLIKFDLDEAIRVSSNDEVDLGPVHHDYLLDVVHDIWELRRRQSLQTLVLLRRSEISMKEIFIAKPLGSL